MLEKDSLTAIAQPVPELPVSDVERAREYYRDHLGFELGWSVPRGDGPGSELAAVTRGKAILFFRRRVAPFEPAVHWVFASRIGATHDELKSLGCD
jgi:catechol 2,3-dioxygenase-like lactoylglutathione lyase family enzyme